MALPVHGAAALMSIDLPLPEPPMPSAPSQPEPGSADWYGEIELEAMREASADAKVRRAALAQKT